MSELNAEQVKKALECCANRQMSCNNCPYVHEDTADDGSCAEKMEADALALITSQEQRIKELTEENERLKKDNEYILMQHAFQRRPSGDCWNDVIEKAKADTVRKMQERLKEKAFQKTFICLNGESYVVYLNDIDQIAKEMLEGANG